MVMKNIVGEKNGGGKQMQKTKKHAQ